MYGVRFPIFSSRFETELFKNAMAFLTNFRNIHRSCDRHMLDVALETTKFTNYTIVGGILSMCVYV